MNPILRKIIRVSIFILVVGFVLFKLNVYRASAKACTTAQSGDWATSTTWTSTNGCNVAGGPVAGDTITIASGHAITVGTQNVAAATITFGTTTAAATSLTINNGFSLTLSGTLTIPAAGSTGGNTVTVGGGTSGSLSAAGISIAGSTTSSRFSKLALSAGSTVTTTAGITFSGTAAQAQLVGNATATINLTGTFGSGGTVTTNNVLIVSTGTAQINQAKTFGNVAVSSGTLTAGVASIIFGGTLTIADGATMSLGNFAFTATGLVTVGNGTSGILKNAAAGSTGTYAFNGGITINSGGTLNLSTGSATHAITLAGSVTNNSAVTANFGGGTTTLSTNTGKTIGGTGPVSFGALTINANIAETFDTTVSITGNLSIASFTSGTPTITINDPFSVGGTFTWSAPSVAMTIALGSSANFSVTGTTAFTLPSTAVTSTLNVGAATATFGGTLTMTGSTTSAIGKIILTSGTLNFNAGINTAGSTSATAADHVIDISGGAGAINLDGQVATTNSYTASGWTFTNTTCSGAGNTFTYADIGNQQNVTTPGSGGYCNLTILSGDADMGSTAFDTSNLKGNLIIGDDINVVSFTNIGSAITGNASKIFTLNNLATYKQTQQVAERLPTGFGTITLDSNSTVEYDSTASYTISSSYSFGNLAFKPTTAGLTFTLPSSVSIANDLIIGNGTNAVTVNANTNDPVLSIPGAFTINDGGTFNASNTASLTIGGVMTIGGGTSGTFTENGGTIYLNNDLVINAGATFTDNTSSQFRFTKGSAQTITDNTATKQDLGSVFTATTGTSVTSTTSIAVTDLTIGSGTSFDISSDTLTVSDTSGTLITNSGTFTTTGSTIAVTGSGTKTLLSGVSTINNLTISSTGTNNTNILSNLTLNGDLAVGSTSTLTVNTATFTVSGSVSNDGTLVSSYSSGLISVGANWTNTGTYTAGTSTVKLVSTSSSDITFAGGGSTYNDLWLAHGSGTGDYVITGDNTFDDFKDDGTAAHAILFTAGSTTTVTTFTVSGTSGNLITINSGDGAGGTSTSTHTLTKAGGGTISVDYVSVQHSVATPSSTWTAGMNSTDNNSVATAGSGWSFTTSSQGPYGGTPWNIPGTIQFEDYDTGGQGVAYNDTDPLINQAGQYRPSEGVDIEATQDITGSYNLGWVYNTEWTEYTVNVTTAGTYTLSVRVASLTAGNVVVKLDGAALTTVTTPNTGGYQVWQTGTSSNFSLSAGSHILRYEFDNNLTNYNYMTFNLVAASGCTSNATGNWNDSTKWNCAHVPTTGDDVTITSGHTITMNVDSAVLGNITVNGTLNTSGYALSGSSISIGSSGAISAGSSAITLSGTSGTLLSSAGGTFTPSSSTLTLSGNGTAMINSGITTLNSVSITGTGTKYIGSATTLNGSLTIGASSTFGAGFDLTVAGSVTNNGTYLGGGWQYYKSVTIDHTKVPNTDQTDFPVLINGTYADLKSIAYGGHVFSNSGYDIAFFSDSALTNPLKWEVETYSPTSGLLIAWVKVPSLSHTADTSIYIGYGNIGVTSDQSDKNNVWDSSYKAVWHLDEAVSGNGQTLANSTSFSENLTTNSSSAYSGVQITAPVGSGMSINKATNDYLAFPQVTLTGAWTIEGWVKLTTSPDQFSSLFGNGSSGGGLVFNTNWFASLYRAWDGSTDDIVATNTISSGTWYHYVITRSGTAMALYLNGNSDKTSTNGKNAVFQHLGVNADGSTSNSILFDEVRISTAQRSADWVKTEYNNQNSPSTFYSVGTETSVTSSSATTTAVAGSWTNTGTFNVPGVTIKMTDNSGNPTFAGGGATYTKLWLAPGAGTGTYTIAGNNTFGELEDDGTAAHTVKFTAGSTQTITTWNISGTSGNLITLDSTTTGTYNLTKPSNAAETRADYLNIKHSVATPGNAWYAGENSVDNQSIASAGEGWIFTTRTKHRGGGGGNAGSEGTGSGTLQTGGGNGGGGGTTGGETGNGTGAGTCSDQIQNGNETGVDSGGRCGNTGGGNGGGGGGDVGFLFFFQHITLPTMSMWFALR